MAKYTFDNDKAKSTFDSMFGSGAYNAGIADAVRIGRGIGQAKLEEKRKKEEERERKKAEAILEAARKEAAKQEREKKKQKEKEKKSGRKDTKLSKENENKKKRLKDAGIDPDDTRNAFEKATNLEKDQNFFFDGLELLDRGRNAVANVLLGDAEHGKKVKEEIKKQEKKLGRKLSFDEKVKATGKAQQKMEKEGKTKGYGERLKEGVTGKKDVSGSDILKEAGMGKGAGRAVAGFGLDVAIDPLNFAGGAIGKGVKGAAKGVNNVLDRLPGMDKVKDGVDEIFSGKRLKSKTIDGGRSDELLDIERQMENQRLFMQDQSANSVAKAIKEADKFDGTVIGKEMERPLNAIRPLDTKTAPNVLDKSALFSKAGDALDDMKLGSFGQGTTRNIDEIIPFSNVRATSRLQRLKEFPPETHKVYRNKVKPLPADEVSISASAFVPKEDFTRLVKSGKTEEAAEIYRKHHSIKSAAKTLMASNAELRKFASENGIELTDLEGYMAHFLTKEARKKIEETGGVVSDGVARIGGNKKVLNRNLHDSVENINRKKGMEYFNPDAFVATAGGQHRMINAIVRESVKKQVLGNANFAKEIPSHKKARKGFEMVSIDGKNYEVTRGAAQVIKNFDKNVTDEGIQKILTGFDKLQNAWKKTALFSVGFHARNYIGNAWNMHLSGMRPDQVVAGQLDATDTIIQANKKLTGQGGKISDAEMKLYDEFRQQGLKGTGSMADFRVNPEDELMSNVRYKGKGALGKVLHEFAEVGKQEGAWNKTKQAADSVFASSRRYGDVADETARLAMFKWARKKGMSPEEAASKVRETLFDYTELTPAEQQVFKRMAPFYTWLRKNSEFQMKSFLKNPEKFNRIQSATNNAYDNTDMDEELVPEYLKENLAIPIPGMDRLASLGLPAADLSKWTDPGKVLMDSLSPLLKVPMELGMNQKTFNGAPISQFEGQTKEFLGMELPAGAAYVGEQIAPLRRLSGTMTEDNSMENPADAAAKLLGGDLLKKYDQDKFQEQFDWKEKERLDDLIQKTEKTDGKDVRTLNEMKKAGVPVDEEEAATQEELNSLGLSEENVSILMNLKKKVYNNDAEYAAKIAEMLQGMGVPPEAVDVVTRDYLEY
jgi:hypothetical protein